MMKRLALALAVLLILSGCSRNEGSPQSSRDKRPVQKGVQPKKRSAAAKFKVEKLIVNSSGGDVRPIIAKIKPRDAQVDLVAEAQGSDTVKVNIKIAARGTGGGNPVIVFLAKPGHVSQQYFIYEPITEVTATLLRSSGAGYETRELLERAGRVYRLKTAYPRYLPTDLKLSKALYDENLQSGTSLGFLLFKWSTGSRGLMMQFLSQPRLRMGRPPEYESAVKVDDDLEAKLEAGSEHADFFINGQMTSWYISGQGLSRREFMKIIKSMKLSEE